jgi:16S rRNA U1498 N3-methylase RsmE
MMKRTADLWCLGPHVMRIETAAVAAAANLLSRARSMPV